MLKLCFPNTAQVVLKSFNTLYRYKWKFNEKDFNPSGQDDRVVQLPNSGTIVFNAPEDKDEGIYQCFASNDLGVSASVKINLREAKLASFAIEDSQVRIGLLLAEGVCQ